MSTPPLMVSGPYGPAIHSGERNDQVRQSKSYRPRSVYSLWVVLDGVARLLTPAGQQTLDLPAAVLLFPLDDHAIEITSGSTWRSLRFDVVQVPRRQRGPGAHVHVHDRPQPPPLAVWGRIPARVVPPERVAACRRMVEHCIAGYWRGDLAYAQANADLGVWLINQVAATADPVAGDPLAAHARAVRDRAPGQGVVATMAARAGFSRQHFSFRFRQKYGQPPRAFAIQECLRQARDLLRGSDLTVAEVARICGYRSPAAFVRRFRADAGLPPGRWRREAAG
jgi:AraC-like DNA-binding protein